MFHFSQHILVYRRYIHPGTFLPKMTGSLGCVIFYTYASCQRLENGLLFYTIALTASWFLHALHPKFSGSGLF